MQYSLFCVLISSLLICLVVSRGIVRCALAGNAMTAAKQIVDELKTKYRQRLTEPAVVQALATYDLLSEYPIGNFVIFVLVWRVACLS